MMRDTLSAICLLSSLALRCAHGQELSLLDGRLQQQHTEQRTYAWALDYQHRLGQHAALGLVYLNEGHPDNHHRDGIGAQIWARSEAPVSGFSLAAGAGPYYYFDTTSLNVTDYRNEHGWGMLASVAATWQTQRRWFVQLRANRVLVSAGINTSSLLLGVGYRLDGMVAADAQRALPPPDGAGSGSELTLSAGRTVVNSFNSERSTATSLEYRRGLGRHLDWTLSWLYEGDTRLLHRQGVAAQLWLVHPLHNERLALAIGAGPYLAADEPAGDDRQERLAGLLSLSARYRASPDLLLRFSWNRVLTDYHRDSDVLLIGIGHAF